MRTMSCHYIQAPVTLSLTMYVCMVSSTGLPPDPVPEKQSLWDSPGLLVDHALSELLSRHRARFLAAQVTQYWHVMERHQPIVEFGPCTNRRRQIADIDFVKKIVNSKQRH